MPAAWPGWQHLRRSGRRGRHSQPPAPPGVRAAVPAFQLPAPPPVVTSAKDSKPAEWAQEAPASHISRCAAKADISGSATCLPHKHCYLQKYMWADRT